MEEYLRDPTYEYFKEKSKSRLSSSDLRKKRIIEFASEKSEFCFHPDCLLCKATKYQLNKSYQNKNKYAKPTKINGVTYPKLPDVYQSYHHFLASFDISISFPVKLSTYPSSPGKSYPNFRRSYWNISQSVNLKQSPAMSALKSSNFPFKYPHNKVESMEFLPDINKSYD